MSSLPRRSTRPSSMALAACRPNLCDSHFVRHLKWDDRQPVTSILYTKSNTMPYLEVVGRVSCRNFFMDTAEYHKAGEPLHTSLATCALERPCPRKYGLLWDESISSLQHIIRDLSCNSPVHGLFDDGAIQLGYSLYRSRVCTKLSTLLSMLIPS
jgi:hypothetical protein